MDTLTLEQFRRQLSDAVGRAEHGGKATYVTRHGHPAAVLISPDDYEDLIRLRDEYDRKVVLERQAAAQADPDRMVAFNSAEELRTALGSTGDASPPDRC
ncbi:prevent-host-death family protein [Nocardiopsis gilva YIM 90087]|uniref:Antitoxin n=1 Tax=Nocardiopsis gilva YIM 90087 TaxID=1235441 RepID=A0A223S284_9ACTN|nr:type II toxin-antitoxin system Phd/YefM family antitoxin [Nocardiopsis gilva]ASU82235.1 prevent-host-death family protein [Nocardiopsis gilva YIM 90087]